jgi:hypothetical protein
LNNLVGDLFWGTYSCDASFGINRRGSHDEIPALVYPFCIMLAAGAAGIGSLPPRLVDSSAVQDYRNSGGWNPGIDSVYHQASGPHTEQNMMR